MIGKTLAHYKIISKIVSVFRMGDVYRAHDEHLDRYVAIKVLRSELLADDAARHRFCREALLLSELIHPNVCRVFDFGHKDGTAFIVMELVEGETLRDRLFPPLPGAEVVRLGRQIAGAMEAAHERGVTHGDLTRDTILLSPTGDIKVLGFGLWRAFDALLTREPTLTFRAASPWASPEQVREEASTTRTDIHALGAVLYWMATAKFPFSGESAPALDASILNDAPVPPHKLGAKLPPEVEAMILRCLEKEPLDRYASAREAREALEGASWGL